ncbi:MAG: CpsD/CapB family tyrosine-protein kinase [Promethearchaeota archaeon]
MLLFGGFVISVVGAFGTILIFDFINPSIYDDTDIKSDIDLPILSSIPVIHDEDEFRMLRTHLLFNEAQDNAIKTLILTSLNANEGKSLTISNLAITIAQQKIPTVLIDADLRRGVLHRSFACEKKPGLSDLLNSSAGININNIQKILQETHVPNLFLISSGTQYPNPSELLGSFRMKFRQFQ